MEHTRVSEKGIKLQGLLIAHSFLARMTVKDQRVQFCSLSDVAKCFVGKTHI